jgi:hypothetical protein
LYKTVFKKKEKFNGNPEGNHITDLEESEQFTPDGLEENESLNGTEDKL